MPPSHVVTLAYHKNFVLKTWPSHHRRYLVPGLVGKGRGMVVSLKTLTLP